MDPSTSDVRYLISGICFFGAALLFFLGHKPDFVLWRLLRIPIARWARLNRMLALVVRVMSIVLLVTSGAAFFAGIYALWIPMIAIPLVLAGYYGAVAFSAFRRPKED